MYSFLEIANILENELDSFLKKNKFNFVKYIKEGVCCLVRKDLNGFDCVYFHSWVNGFRCVFVAKRVNEIENYISQIAIKHDLPYSEDSITVRLLPVDPKNTFIEFNDYKELKYSIKNILFYLIEKTLPFFSEYKNLDNVLSLIKNSNLDELTSNMHGSYAIFRALIVARLYGDPYYEKNKVQFRLVQEKNLENPANFEYKKKILEAYNDLIIELDNLKPKYNIS